MPPPRGCVLVQKRGVCCSYVSCSKFHLLNKGGYDRRTGVSFNNNKDQWSRNGIHDSSLDNNNALPNDVQQRNALHRRIDDDNDGNIADGVEGNDECE